MQHALRWRLQFPTTLPSTFHYDCAAAGGAAGGTTAAHGDMPRQSRALVQLIQQIWPITFAHVRAHSDQPWNELSDVLAKHAATTKIQPAGIPDMQMTTQQLEWAWIFMQQTVCHNKALPQIINSSMQCEFNWKPAQLDGLAAYRDKAVCKNSTHNPLAKKRPAEDEEAHAPLQVQLQVLTLNVLTLRDAPDKCQHPSTP